VGRPEAGWKQSTGRSALVAVGGPDDARSCRLPYVSMVQATDFGNLHDRAHLRSLDGSHVGRIWWPPQRNGKRRRRQSNMLIMGPDCPRIRAERSTVWPPDGVLAKDNAYCLKYRNRRPDYLSAWWKVIAWDVVDKRLRAIMAGTTSPL
jgi:hypothetical protein